MRGDVQQGHHVPSHCLDSQGWSFQAVTRPFTYHGTKINTALDAMFAPNSVQNGTPSTFENRKQLSIMTENILSLIWSLAEANHKTLAAINAARVEGLLLRSIVGREQFALGVALAAGEIFAVPLGFQSLTRNRRSSALLAKPGQSNFRRLDNSGPDGSVGVGQRCEI